LLKQYKDLGVGRGERGKFIVLELDLDWGELGSSLEWLQYVGMFSSITTTYDLNTPN
jgi:hypothetical protein